MSDDEASRNETEHREAEVVGCRYCLVGPGHPCVNQARVGRLLKHPHPERLRDARRETRGA